MQPDGPRPQAHHHQQYGRRHDHYERHALQTEIALTVRVETGDAGGQMFEKVGVVANAADASRSRTRSSCRFGQLLPHYLAKMNIYCRRMISNGVSCRPVRERRRRTCDEVQLWQPLPFLVCVCVSSLLNHRPPAACSRTTIRNARSTQYSPIIAGIRDWHHDQLIPSKCSCVQAPRVRLASRRADHECIIMRCGQVAANAPGRRPGYGYAVRFIACHSRADKLKARSLRPAVSPV